jgi:hypothetical protein
MERQIIPRNVLSEKDTLPIDCIGHFEIEIRQIPYVIVGIAGATAIVMTDLVALKYKIIISAVSIGTTYVISMTKFEGQTIGTLLINLIKYLNDNRKIKRGIYNVNKNFEGRIRKFTRKNRHNKKDDNK